MLGITTKKGDTVAKDTEAKAEPQPGLPLMDVYESDSEFLLVADLPGVPQDGADVTLEHNRLVVQGSGARKYRRELIVPPSVEAEKVSAAMKAGVLTVHLPKRAPYQPRQIQVKSA